MQLAILAFFFGIVSALSLPVLPSISVLIAVTILSSIGLRWCFQWRVLFYFLLGFSWLCAHAHWILSQQLPAMLEGQDIQVQGQIVHLPQKTAFGWRFDFIPSQLHWRQQGRQQDFPSFGTVRLNWYGDKLPTVLPQQTWQFTVRLKRTHSLLNPAATDYSSYLLQQRIRAIGYIRPQGAQLLSDSSHLFSIDNFRYTLRQNLHQALSELPSQGIFIALTLGERYFITEAQWQVLRHTGTAHLVAISGLHISLIAVFVFWLIRTAWASIPALALRVPAPRIAACAAIIAALAYALLAGWSIPTQRAFIMVSIAASGHLFARQLSFSRLLSLALLGVLLWDPFAPLSAGFWLSFAAVAILWYFSRGRLWQAQNRWRRAVQQFSRSQWALMLGLAPLSLSLFGFISLSSFFANALAIPLIAFYIPLALSSVLCLLLWPPLGIWCVQNLTLMLDQLWWLLQVLSETPWAIWQQAPPPAWALGFACGGVLILLLPKGMPSRWVGIVWLLPLFFASRPQPKQGDYWLTVLDVGQGLAVVVQTAQHTLVYDTGPSFRSGFNTGEAVVLPFLQAQGVQQIDTLLISHEDTDHSGSASTLLDGLAVREILTSAPKPFGSVPHRACETGQQWQWDGVEFSILHPATTWRGNDNDRSCVLKISNTHISSLLTGDILARSERYLTHTNRAALTANIIVVPHHGSTSSSTLEFVQAVSPQWVLFSSGYLNRFGFPKPDIVARYQHLPNAQLFNTAEHGALLLRISDTVQLDTARERYQRFWHE